MGGPWSNLAPYPLGYNCFQIKNLLPNSLFTTKSLRMHQKQSQDSLKSKISGGACPQTPLEYMFISTCTQGFAPLFFINTHFAPLGSISKWRPAHIAQSPHAMAASTHTARTAWKPSATAVVNRKLALKVQDAHFNITIATNGVCFTQR